MSDETDLEWCREKFHELVVPSLMKLSSHDKKRVIGELWNKIDVDLKTTSLITSLARPIKKPNLHPSIVPISAGPITNIMQIEMSAMAVDNPEISFKNWPESPASMPGSFPNELRNGFIAIFIMPKRAFATGWIISRGPWVIGNVWNDDKTDYVDGGGSEVPIVLTYEDEPWLEGILEHIFYQCRAVYGWRPAPPFHTTINWSEFPKILL